MMNMMYGTGWGGGLTFLWGIHIISVIAFFAGVVLLLAWAIKHVSAAKQKQWGWGLVIVGTIACLITIGAIGRPWIGFGPAGFGAARMMQGIAWDDDDWSGGMMDGGMGMSMNGMTMMLKGKTGDAFDRVFLQMMIPHHQGAIEMAELALEQATHQELKDMAEAIISAQQQEIDRMHDWQAAWGYAQ